MKSDNTSDNSCFCCYFNYMKLLRNKMNCINKEIKAEIENKNETEKNS